MAAAAGYIPPWHDTEVRELTELAGHFYDRHMEPNRLKFTGQRAVDRWVWEEAGRCGLLCCSIPQEYGGGGGDIAHDLAIVEAEVARPGNEWGHLVHALVAHYILEYGTPEQRQQWLPKMARGEVVAAIAMTEPSAGSDLKSLRTRASLRGDRYVINGSKTFISNGALADLILVVAKTDPTAGAKGISLICVEPGDAAGFQRGRNLVKLGLHSYDTVELFFHDVEVPAENLLGGVPGEGFAQLMAQLPRERLIAAATAVCSMEVAVCETVSYAKDRLAFDQRLMDMQNTRFVLAEAATAAHAARVYLDSCVIRFRSGALDAVDAAMCKWWLTDQQCRVIDSCLQVFGGYGYMAEYPIARLYANARVQKIYAGTNEIMKEIVARSL
ncbi:acyl-CoA dehydrogenase family protein [Nocardia sp. NPDC049707]|uniref:acyl-CoA dehydrogenase family protein n=1 Tax=Nocardia sp. NPDC049707 TaxID=3154735 RepID=UPI003445D58D